jgi:predicted permease
MGIPLISGRDFNEEDGHIRNSVAIVDQRFARRYWPGADPVGKRIRIRAQNEGQGEWYKSSGLDQWLTVVGLTREVAYFGLDRPAEPAVYIPYHKWERSHYFVLVRSKMDPVGIVAPIRSQLSKLDPDVAMFSPMMMTEVVDGYTYYRRVFSMVMTIFAAAALMIAVAGLYGIVNYTVSRRTREIGIRMALGATRGQVLSMILGGGMRLVIIGAVFGLAGAFVASRALGSMLFGITRLDVPTYFMVGVVLLIAVVLATIVPARRAASIEPVRALRTE